LIPDLLANTDACQRVALRVGSGQASGFEYLHSHRPPVAVV
jgi:hypothetical protein